MSNIIIVGAFRFPDGDAAAKRVYGFGKYFRKEKCKVEYISWGNEGKINEYRKYDGFQYVSLDEFNNGQGNILHKIKSYLQLGNKTISLLKKKELNNTSTLIAYNGTSIFLLRLWFLCKRQGATLVLDCTEWYDSNHLVGGKFGIIALDNYIRMQIINPIIGNLIVISSYLYNFYNPKVKNICKVPFLMDIKEQENKFIEIENKDIKLFYIGNPGKKDKFDVLLDAIVKYNTNYKRKIYLDIYGLTEEQYLNGLNYNEETNVNNNFISFKGRIENSKVASLYCKYHFSILLRPHERYAYAGFPTKLVESLSYGVPMIASDVGDIGFFIKNEKSGYLIKELLVKELISIFNQIMLLSNQKYFLMKNDSFLIANNNFSYKNESSLLEFIRICNE